MPLVLVATAHRDARVDVLMLFLLGSCSRLLFRVSFSADEFWAAHRRLQGPTLMEKIRGGIPPQLIHRAMAFAVGKSDGHAIFVSCCGAATK
jgi:hypothetical protein